MGTRIELGDDGSARAPRPLLTFRRTVRVLAGHRRRQAERRGDLEPHIEHRISGISPSLQVAPSQPVSGPMPAGAIGAEFWVVDEGRRPVDRLRLGAPLRPSGHRLGVRGGPGRCSPTDQPSGDVHTQESSIIRAGGQQACSIESGFSIGVWRPGDARRFVTASTANTTSR